jgi:GT2 family glycosyltransferase
LLVVGMHRSGTSAVAGALARLGWAPPRPGDLMQHVWDNPRGHYESLSLAAFDEEILARLGGSWERPPVLEEGFELDASLDDLAAAAPGVLTRAFENPDAPAVWKDPRLCLLLPFWSNVVAEPLPAVFVVRDPLEVALSLLTRNAMPLVKGVALWERYVRSALRSLRGMPVLVVDYPAIVSDATGLAKGVDELLVAAGLEPVGASGTGEATAFLDPALRHQRSDASRPAVDGLLLPGQRELYEGLAALAGAHHRFDPGALGGALETPVPGVAPGAATAGLPGESPWTSLLLSLDQDLEHTFDGLMWAVGQLRPLLDIEGIETGRSEEFIRYGRRGPDLGVDEDSSAEPTPDGPYPLNASEDRRAYHRWLRARHLPVRLGGRGTPVTRQAATSPVEHPDPLISILVPAYRTPRWALERCVGSVLAQSMGDWQLCICDDASGDKELTDYLRSLPGLDRRIVVTALGENGGISTATNAALALATAPFVAFLDHDDELAPQALASVAASIASHPEGDMWYSDEDKIDLDGERFDPFFKPAWSPDLLTSFAYTAHLTVARQSLLSELGGLRPQFDGSQDYDLALRLAEKARAIVHIPEVLYHWRSIPGSAASGAEAKPWAFEAGRRAIEDAMERRGEPAEVTMLEQFPGRYHVRRHVRSGPLVSVIIPFRDEPALLRTCVASMRDAPGYDRFEFVLVDNGSQLPETAALLDELAAEPDVRVVEQPGPFNWPAINNAAAAEAAGELLLFSNNDIEARVPRWMQAMVGHAERPEVGAVGSRLLYPDGAIQHAGVVVGLGGIAGHVLRGLPGTYPGYASMAIQTRNCSVVTGACMMVRREVFESVGGFDERLPVAFNDVDFCLKLGERRLLVVYCPLAELVHHESRSRGHTDDVAETKRILERWGDVIAAGDPYVSPHLSHWRYWCPLSSPQEDARWTIYLKTSVLTHGESSTT